MRALLVALALCCLGQTRVEIYSYTGARARMAATVHTWTNGSADGDWNNVANWNTGALPGSGGLGLDTAIFDGNVTQTGPSVNMDRSGDTVLNRIVIRPNFTGNIGASGNPLIHSVWIVGVSTARVIHRGSGAVYFKVTGNEGTDFVMDGPGQLHLDSEDAPSFGQIRNTYIKAGTVAVASTGSILQYVVVDGPSAALTVAAKDSTEDDPDWIVVNNGIFTNNRIISAAGRAVVFGGKLDQRGLVADLAVMISGPAGRIVYTPDGTLGAGHNPDFLVAGLLDTRGSNQDIVPARLVIAQLGSMLGTGIQVGSGTYVDIDLREEYP